MQPEGEDDMRLIAEHQFGIGENDRRRAIHLVVDAAQQDRMC
jgi:hypothetical protein